MTAGWVYFMTNRPNGILYVGVTDNLPRRAWEHREGLIDGFTKRYGLKRLVYFREVRRHPLRAAARAKSEALLARLESPPHPAE